MSEAVDHVSGGGDDKAQMQAGGEQSIQQEKEKVSYDTYRKTVDAEKKAKAKADELARKLKEYEEKELQAQGKNQELIDYLRTQVKEKETKLHGVVSDFAYTAVSSKIREEALKQGCLDVDLLIKAGGDEFGKIEVDVEKGFSVNESDLKAFFESTMKKHPTLFKKAGPKINDTAPSSVAFDASRKTKKTIDEMAIELANLNNNKP